LTYIPYCLHHRCKVLRGIRKILAVALIPCSSINSKAYFFCASEYCPSLPRATKWNRLSSLNSLIIKRIICFVPILPIYCLLSICNWTNALIATLVTPRRSACSSQNDKLHARMLRQLCQDYHPKTHGKVRCLDRGLLPTDEVEPSLPWRIGRFRFLTLYKHIPEFGGLLARMNKFTLRGAISLPT